MLKFTEFLEKISLEYHTTLNPKLFDLSSLKMHDDVRETLLTFAHTWGSYANIPMSDVKDIYMTGGNANFNYTSQSDIDVHLVVDKRLFGLPDVFLDDYLQDKKTLWKLKHNITVKGYDLEPYAQSPDERFPAGQGVYSIVRDAWVIQPVHGSYDFENDPTLEKKTAYYEREIDRIINSHGTSEAASALKDKLNELRGAGLERAGEFSVENLVFKELRNRGSIDKLQAYAKLVKDTSLSLE